ncbi:arrestin domain-containing protein 3-like [Colossoma macropomum]|uniref:arrestin domain-containing protein 3-like n=1 Tax=Colossoma macropomum TaxID=42526 RepID=UPI001864A69A|nr:arrestin domain-containing protein 3-like [Colossoma macropomum]
MAFTVKKLSITIDPVNDSNTFTNGDCLSGRVTLKVSKETHIQCFSIKAKGKASVLWSEHYGKYGTVVYHDKETVFKSVQYFVQEKKNKGQDGSLLLTNEAGQTYSKIVAPGIHVYPFTFQIPLIDMPASFKGYHGNVDYFLEAKLSRSMRISRKASIYFNYVPEGDMSIPDLMMPQCGNTEKKMKFFSSGSVAMNISTERMGYRLGEVLKVRIDIENNSSQTVKPKFCFYQKQSFFASKKRKLAIKKLLKYKGSAIERSTKTTMTEVLYIPEDTCVSILNCKVLKVEYRLKVCLDVKFASNPEIKLPVVLLCQKETSAAAPVDMHIGFDSWTSSQAGWNSSADYSTVHGRNQSLNRVQ